MPSRPDAHPSDRPGPFSRPGRHLARLGGVNPVPPIPLPKQLRNVTFLVDITTGGIGARSGVDAVRAR